MKSYDTIIVGGGIAGLQAAIQLGRYSTIRTLVIDAGYGRSTLCRSYHNLLGFPDGISGEELRKRGEETAASLGIEFLCGRAVEACKQNAEFLITLEGGEVFGAPTLLLATGVIDRFPDLPGLVSCLGSSMYICPDCDGYEVQNRRTVVLGAGKAGADMALTLSDRTDQLIYINHEKTGVPDSLLNELRSKDIRYIEAAAAEVVCPSEGQLSGVRLEDGETIEAEKGFIAFGGNHVHSGLAEQLGVKLLHNRHVETDARSKMTNIEHVWAAGDLGAHSEQAAVAMGEGLLSAIWIHKALVKIKQKSATSR
ncbi:NAD(P)/FAD-dependent oxidoreductase [Paenibacillus sp. P96]|uniref:NAD(P)/FAD-dependent oxidoreductase n=1 Tax=Paenibacillus zeirhizosphaerae TaxID=2987519 RepID=A0ABT9FSF5_9BACL|nr:NAD(P)/FAD-dependent oxidoreductase [Paenibacillus sp. P96]MDP4097407.1 NAD(P)/FAD-dependent oxidoreductase [Paenibacillus sp. P96]